MREVSLLSTSIISSAMARFAALRCNFSLLILIHRREAAVAFPMSTIVFHVIRHM